VMPVLSHAELEAAALALEAEVGAELGSLIEPPVPFELTLDVLRLSLEVADLSSGQASPVLGAISFSRRTVFIDRKTVVGVRFGFTVCHEIGHWRLHQPAFGIACDDTLCRDEDDAPREREAERFAAYYLMPAWLVRSTTEGRDARDPGVLARLAIKFGASRQAMSIRLSQLGLL